MTPLLSTKRLRMVLAVLGLGGMHGLVQAQSPATDSLRQIEYRLHKDPGAPVEPALRDLVQRPGQYVAMRLLADVLAGSGQSDKIREAMRWYQQAFAQGRGEVNALLSLVRMVAKHGADRAQHEAFFADAVARFSPQRDFGSLRTALEIFFVYPTLYSVRQVEDMLALYAQSCISDCV
ncbi:MAG: PHB depolymerase family esterase, partial [Gammaproteobacteria bacterium]|nr:PHB depolymerase family esterase [Gammaproteobacteria bacterium]